MELPRIPLVKDRGVYWLDVERSPRKQPTETVAAPNPKAVRPVVDAAMGDAPLQEDLEPEGEAGRKAKAKKAPASVSAELRAEHELTHLSFRSWCEACVKGKRTEDFHRRCEEKKKEDTARYCIDYYFFTRALSKNNAVQSIGDLQEARPESKTVLVCRDQKSGALFAGVANSKGAEDAYSTAFALDSRRA